MTSKSNSAAGPKRERPRHGGTFIRDPKTGAIECVTRPNTATAAARPAAAGEPGPGTPEASGGAGSGTGSIDATQQKDGASATSSQTEGE